MIKVRARVTAPVCFFLLFFVISDNNVKGMPHCSTETPCCHLHLRRDATHALAHTLHVGTARAHVHKAAPPLRSPSRGHRENRNVLDAALKASSVRLYIARQVVTVFQNVSFTNNHRPCQKFFSMTAECSPYLYKPCQLSRFWKSGGKKSFFAP